MGGSSGQQKQESQTSAPWAPAQASLQGILGQLNPQSAGITGAENAAISGLASNASQGNPFSAGISGVASNLLAGGGPDRTGMVNDAYSQYQAALNPFARGDYVNPESNPALRGYLDVIKGDITKSLGAGYAGSGRAPSGAGSYGTNWAEGYTRGAAPVVLDAYNQGIAGQRSAIDSMFGAGGTTAGLLSGLDQTKLGNQVAGVQAAGAATEAQNAPFMQMLQVEAARRGIPLQALAQMAGIAQPIAGLGGQVDSSGQSSKEMSGAEQFGAIAGGIGKLFGK